MKVEKTEKEKSEKNKMTDLILNTSIITLNINSRVILTNRNWQSIF